MRKTRKEDVATHVPEDISASRTPSLFQSGPAWVFFGVAFFLNIALWTTVFVRIGIGEGMVVLRYNIYFGIDLTGSPFQAFLIPLIATIFFVINVFITWLFVRRGVLFPGLFLAVLTFFVQIAAGIEVFALILIN